MPIKKHPVRTLIFMAISLVVGLIGVFRPTGPDLSSGDCIAGGNQVKEVDCSSPSARYRIGSPCEVILTIRQGGSDDQICAYELD